MTRPWTTVDSAATPEGALELKQRGEQDFLITLEGRVVMTSARHRSEDALARLACEAVAELPGPKLLVSGLGMGFTLRAALDLLPPDARVTVAELNPAVARWCRGPLGPLTRHAVADPRVTLEVDDVARVIERAALAARVSPRARFDAVVLDMYQGPPSVVRDDDPLYGRTAVARTRAALSDRGAFAVWCEGTSRGFERVLTACGFRVQHTREGRGGGGVHQVYLARPADRPADRSTPRGSTTPRGGPPRGRGPTRR